MKQLTTQTHRSGPASAEVCCKSNRLSSDSSLQSSTPSLEAMSAQVLCIRNLKFKQQHTTHKIPMRYLPGCIIPTVKCCGGGIIAQGDFILGLGLLCLKGDMNATSYKDILDNWMALIVCGDSLGKALLHSSMT